MAARLIINVKDLETARELARWYEGCGEQYAEDWFNNNRRESAPITVVSKNWIKVDKINQTVEISTK